MDFYEGIYIPKDLKFIIIKDLAQMRYENVLNQYRYELRLIKKYNDNLLDTIDWYSEEFRFNSIADCYYYHYKSQYLFADAELILNIKHLKSNRNEICLNCGCLHDRTLRCCYGGGLVFNTE